jgi:hypothetical protein
MAAALSHCGLWQIQMQIRSTDTADGPKVWMMERPLSLVQAVELGKLKQSRKNRFWLVPSMYSTVKGMQSLLFFCRLFTLQWHYRLLTE